MNATATPTSTSTQTVSAPAHATAFPSAVPSLALPALVLLALAVAAIVLGRRRRSAPRLVQVLEQTSLGPKRALVLARLGDEVLLLGSSEAGITLLKVQPASPEALQARPQPEPAREPAPVSGAVASLVARLAGRAVRPEPVEGSGAAPRAGFEDLLAESAEDQELRRKIAAGRGGSVR